MRLGLAAPPLASALLAASLAVGCGKSGGGATDLPDRVGGAVRITADSPFTPGCDGAAGTGGTLYRGAEVEPWLAVDPLDDRHLVAVWQQDRWSTGGAAGLLTAVSRDGGASWTGARAPFTRCAGGAAAPGGDYERASDPWAAIAADGTVHQIALAFDRTVVSGLRRQAILASRSTDGGLTWSPPIALAADTSTAVALDKESISVDPADASRVYAVWDRLTGFDLADGDQRGTAWMARSLDGGLSWAPATAIYDPGLDAEAFGHQVAVLPDGSLVDLFLELRGLSAAEPAARIALLRSTDRGASWSLPIEVAAAQPTDVVDPEAVSVGVRGGEALPAVAVDRASGRLWVAWSDARFSGGARDGIALAHSGDGGLTWTAPLQANRAPAAAAFAPALAVGSDGTLAVAYLDLREDATPDPNHLWAAAWLATTSDGGATWREAPLGAPFDLRRAPSSGGLFVGDYLGLVARGGSFTALFVMTNPGAAGGATDVFAGGPAGAWAGP